MVRRAPLVLALLALVAAPHAANAFSNVVDFEVTSIAVVPGSPADGDAVLLRVVVTNTGGQPAPPPAIELTLDETSLGRRVSPIVLRIGETTEIDWEYQAVEGTHVALAELKPTTPDEDKNPLNNRRDRNFDVRPPQKADLVVESMVLDPAEPEDGERVTVTATVRNVDDVDPSPPSAAALLVNGAVRARAEVPALLKGEGRVVTFTWSATAGSIELAVVADYGGAVREESETNNALRLNLEVPEPPPAADLVLTSIVVPPGPHAEGDVVDVRVTVTNAGLGASGSFTVRVADGGPPREFATIPSLAPDAATTLTWPWTLAGGPRRLTATADPPLDVVDADLTNNELRVDVDFRPDLTVLDVALSPDPHVVGERVVVSARVGNVGALRSDGTLVHVRVDGAPVGAAVDVGRVAVGETPRVEVEFTAEAGHHTVEVSIETTMSLADAVPANDLLRTVFSLLPDLTVDSIVFTPEAPKAGDAVRVDVVVRNAGRAPSAPTQARLTVAAAVMTPHLVPALAAGGTHAAAWTWPSGGAGTYAVAAAADPVAGEASTANSLSRTLVVEAVDAPAGPNLRVDALSWTPTTPKIGDVVTFTVRVKNVGGATAPASSLSIELDGSVLGARDVEALAAGAVAARSWTWTADLEGETGVLAIADATALVDEGSGEADNELARAVDVAGRSTSTTGGPEKPNLIVLSLTASPAKPAPGASVLITARVKNAGTAMASASAADLRVKSASLGLRNVPSIPAGSTADVTWTWTAVPGTATALASADSTADVAEADERDNARTLTIEVAPLGKATADAKSPSAPRASGLTDEPGDEPPSAAPSGDAATPADGPAATSDGDGSTARVGLTEVPAVPRKWIVAVGVAAALGAAGLAVSMRRRP